AWQPAALLLGCVVSTISVSAGCSATDAGSGDGGPVLEPQCTARYEVPFAPVGSLRPSLSMMDTPFQAFDLSEARARADGTLFVCSGDRGLQVIDAHDPTQMSLRQQLHPSHGDPLSPGCQHIAFDGDTVYVTNSGD